MPFFLAIGAEGPMPIGTKGETLNVFIERLH